MPARRARWQTAAITGGTEGIGFATAKPFVDEGAYILLLLSKLDELVARTSKRTV